MGFHWQSSLAPGLGKCCFPYKCQSCIPFYFCTVVLNVMASVASSWSLLWDLWFSLVQTERTFSLNFFIFFYYFLFFSPTILKWLDYTFLVHFCFEMLLFHLFAESVTYHSFLVSWNCIDAVKVNLILLHIKNEIATPPALPSILKICLHDVLMHVVFLISSFGANTSPLCLFPTVGALCVLGRISASQQQQF